MISQLLRGSAVFCLGFAAISSQAAIYDWTNGGNNVNWNAGEDSIEDTWNENAPFSSSTVDLSLPTHTSALSAFSSYRNINLGGHHDTTISGAPGETVTLDLRNFALADHSTFTLQGTATTTFVINVTKQFSLSGNSQIVLSGSVRWDHVFFNVLGPGGAASLSGKAQLYGTLTASLRTVKMRGQSIAYGAVVANRVALRGAAQIVPCPVVSP